MNKNKIQKGDKKNTTIINRRKVRKKSDSAEEEARSAVHIILMPPKKINALPAAGHLMTPFGNLFFGGNSSGRTILLILTCMS